HDRKNAINGVVPGCNLSAARTLLMPHVFELQHLARRDRQNPQDALDGDALESSPDHRSVGGSDDEVEREWLAAELQLHGHGATILEDESHGNRLPRGHSLRN